MQTTCLQKTRIVFGTTIASFTKGDRLMTALNLLKTTFSEWQEDKVPRWGAALAYYIINFVKGVRIIGALAVGIHALALAQRRSKK